MNKLTRPTFFDDHAALDALAKNRHVQSYPDLIPYLSLLKAGYDQYIQVAGDVSVVNKVPVHEQTKEFLLAHYASPPSDLAYISEIRSKSEVNTCPMCGSMHSGTLDHIMPKAEHPAFAVFGLNLVPACHKCNNKRGNRIVGANPGERVLHPYFDDVLSERILSAHFEDLGPTPRISVRIVLDPVHPNTAAVHFHKENIVYKTGIRTYLTIKWAQLIRRPSLIAIELRFNPPSRNELIAILERERDRADDALGSKNNWDSIFLSGLLCPPVIDWLHRCFSQAGRASDAPLVP